jgi:hypothetical protein
MNVTEKPLGLNTTFDSALIHALARQAAERCIGAGNFDALASVILAYTAFEAFLNEFAQLPQTLLCEQTRQQRQSQSDAGDPHQPILERLALAMRVAQETRTSVEYRYDLAWEILTGARIARGEGARQMLSALTKLRNDLVHAKSGESEILLRVDPEEAVQFNGIWLGRVVERHQHPGYFKVLRDKCLLADGDETAPWIDLVCTRNIAYWACDTVEELAAQLLACAPTPSEFHQRLESYSLGGNTARKRSAALSGRRLNHE